MDKASARFKAATLALLACVALPVAARAAPQRAAVFAFELDDTSLQGAMEGMQPAEQARLQHLDAQLRDALAASGRYVLVDTGGLPPQAAAQSLRNCDACAPALARQAGAQVAVNSWVQKVSNLILNINLMVRDAASGKLLRGGSVDIRGDTDEAWSRGLAWLLRHRILPDAP